jgi:uncharacterized protein YecE (DUF72 family)
MADRPLAAHIRVGTAGWSITRAAAHLFTSEGAHLQRYARVFACAEINSSFQRSHAATTYEKWAASTPPSFRFSVKLPRIITHDQKLRSARIPLERFLDESAGLGNRRGPLLVQLPPSLAFDARVAARFFSLLRSLHKGPVVCEPRHATWCSPQAESLLGRFAVARVAADPPPSAGADVPGGWTGIVYYRLHGAPRRYWSRYSAAQIATLASTLLGIHNATEAWCVFDNTASGAAIENSWELQTFLEREAL